MCVSVVLHVFGVCIGRVEDDARDGRMKTLGGKGKKSH